MALKFTDEIEPNYNGTLIDAAFVQYNNAPLTTFLNSLGTGEVTLLVCETLPPIGEGATNTLYLKKVMTADSSIDYMEQYTYFNGQYIYIGNTQATLANVLTQAMLGAGSDLHIADGVLRIKSGGGSGVSITANDNGTFTLTATSGDQISNIVTLAKLTGMGYIVDRPLTIDGQGYASFEEALRAAVSNANQAQASVNVALYQVLQSVEIKADGHLYAHYSNSSSADGTDLGLVQGPKGDSAVITEVKEEADGVITSWRLQCQVGDNIITSPNLLAPAQAVDDAILAIINGEEA